MAKKSSTHFCYGCDAEFTVKKSEEDNKLTVDYCPFCGDTIDPEEDMPEEDEESEESDDDSWN